MDHFPSIFPIWWRTVPNFPLNFAAISANVQTLIPWIWPAESRQDRHGGGHEPRSVWFNLDAYLNKKLFRAITHATQDFHIAYLHTFSLIFPTYFVLSILLLFSKWVWQYLAVPPWPPAFVPSLVLGSFGEEPNPKTPASMINIKPIYH